MSALDEDRWEACPDFIAMGNLGCNVLICRDA
jgi:hypothetical protein